jgi:hypothetical protein
MTVRSLESRIVKLEAGRRRPNEVLLVWRRPDAGVRAAISGAKFAPGDRVICMEWCGAGPLPAPRWYRERLTSELGAVENEYLKRSLNRVAERDYPRDPGLAELPPVSAQRMCEIPSDDLLHMLLGVAT